QPAPPQGAHLEGRLPRRTRPDEPRPSPGGELRSPPFTRSPHARMPHRRLRVSVITFAATLAASGATLDAQFLPSDELTFLTAEWEGERMPDGRPRVPDDILERMRNVSIEEAWGVLRNHGYHNQFAGEWSIIDEDAPMV